MGGLDHQFSSFASRDPDQFNQISFESTQENRNLNDGHEPITSLQVNNWLTRHIYSCDSSSKCCTGPNIGKQYGAHIFQYAHTERRCLFDQIKHWSLQSSNRGARQRANPRSTRKSKNIIKLQIVGYKIDSDVRIRAPVEDSLFSVVLVHGRLPRSSSWLQVTPAACHQVQASRSLGNLAAI